MFGSAVAVGDVNGDGKRDIAVGAPSEDVGGNTDQGRAYVFSGAGGSRLLFLGYRPTLKRTKRSASSVAAGDMNGDAKADIAVGAPSEDVSGNTDQGRAYVFSGASGATAGWRDWRFRTRWSRRRRRLSHRPAHRR